MRGQRADRIILDEVTLVDFSSEGRCWECGAKATRTIASELQPYAVGCGKCFPDAPVLR